jgi:hypothetical protein
MKGHPSISLNRRAAMKTYTFKVVVEPDEDRWHAYCPALVRHPHSM